MATELRIAKVPIDIKWSWFMAAGLLSIVLGMIALGFPIASSFGLSYLLAAVFFTDGIMKLAQAIELRRHTGAIARVLRSLLLLTVGGLMLVYPESGVLGIALVLSFYFLLGSALQCIDYASLGPVKGRSLGFFSAALSFLLGVFIIVTFPYSALWIPGLLVGVDLIVSGSAMVGLSMFARKARRAARVPPRETRPPTPLRPMPT